MAALLLTLLVPEPAGSRGSAARDRLSSGLAVVLPLLYGALMVPLGDATDPRAAVPWPVDVAIGTVGCLALLLRKRHPVGIAAALVLASGVSVMASGAAAVALFSLAIRRRAPVAVALFAVYVATGPIYHLLQAQPDFPVWVDLAARIIIGAAALGWGMFVQAYRRLTASLRDRAAQLQAEQQLRVEQARLTERSRIAREMHDVLAHRMSLVSLHAGALEVRTDARPEEIALAAGAIRASVHEALQELRTVIGVLREGTAGRPEPPQPGLTDVPDLLDGARAAGMTVGFRCDVPAGGPSVVLGRTAYRLVQEGLTNARKHAPGTVVQVLLDGAAGAELRIKITNPLSGTPNAPAVPGAGLGLIGVRERVGLAGGRVTYGPDGSTFRLEAWLPWPT